MRQHASAHVSIRQHASACVSMRQHASAYVSKRKHTSAYVSIRRDAHTDSGMHVGLQSGRSALDLVGAWGKSEVLKELCELGARGALWSAAKHDLRDMLAELISKGHDLEERDQVLVYEALSCAQVLVYEAFSDLEERDQVLVYEALSCAQVLVYEAFSDLEERDQVLVYAALKTVLNKSSTKTL
jgi:hypothetical protein